jgi:hypothetical protein
MGSSSTADLFRHLNHALTDVATSFTRLRRWSPRSVILSIFMLTQPDQRTSYATLLSDASKEACRLLGWLSMPARSSLSVARAKVPVATFREVLHRLVDHLGSVLPGVLRHHGDRRFVAIDATSLVCPRSVSTLKDLDRPHVNSWLLAHYPRALVVVAFDVMRRLPLEWVLLPKGQGERAATEPLLQRLRPGDVAIVDRGYPARWLLGAFVGRRVDLVMRMTAGKGGTWPEVAAFLKTGAKSAVIACSTGKGASVTVRLLRRNPPPGRPLKHQHRETTVIMTTLLPCHGFEARDIFDLYGRRWGVESLFREMKESFGIERFHARSTAGIEQEIATVLMWMALTSAIHAEAEARCGDGKRASRVVSRSIAQACLADAIAGRESDLDHMLTQALRHAYKPRPGRSFPRVSHLPFGRTKYRGAK